MHMHDRSLAALAVLTAVSLPLATGSAQKIVVNPSSLATVEGGSRISFPFGNSSSNLRLQEICGLSADTNAFGNIQQIAFRRDNDTIVASADYVAFSPDFELVLSTSPRTTQTISDVFANNLGMDATSVHKGVVNWPAQIKMPPGPTSFAYTVVLSQPFTYVFANGDLTLDITTNQIFNPNSLFFLDANAESGGSTSTTLGPGCAGTGVNNALFYSNWGPGMHARALMYNGPPSAPSILSIGTAAPNWFGLLLPFDLAAVGAPGCFVYHDQAILQVSGVTGSTGRYEVYLDIPFNLAIAGAKIRGQYYNPIDPGAGNPLGWSMTAGYEVTLSTPMAGSPAQSEAHASFAAGSTPPTNAQLVQQGYGPIVEVTFQ